MQTRDLGAARRRLQGLSRRWPVLPQTVRLAVQRCLAGDGDPAARADLLAALWTDESVPAALRWPLRRYLLARLLRGGHPALGPSWTTAPVGVRDLLDTELARDLQGWQQVNAAVDSVLSLDPDLQAAPATAATANFEPAFDGSAMPTQADPAALGAGPMGPAPAPWDCEPERAACVADLLSMPDWAAGADRLRAFVEQHGAGDQQGCIAYRFETPAAAPPTLVPLPSMIPFDLDWLQGNADRIAVLRDNTRNLLDGFRAHNALIWGPRGCGKSSLIRGLVTRHWREGLRAVEVPMASWTQLPRLYAAVRRRPERFIAVLDNIALERADPATRALSTALDGGLEEAPPNLVFYATSNFKDLVDRGGERPGGPPVSQADAAPEGLRHGHAGADVRRGFDTQGHQRLDERRALDDRFALKVFIDLPTRSEYGAIVLAYAERAGIDTDPGTLLADFEVWRMRHNHDLVGGRTARDFIRARYPAHARHGPAC